MRSVLLIFVVLLAVSASAEPVVSFPGKTSRVKSPTSELVVSYFDPGENAGGSHEYSLRLEYPGRPVREIDVFTRSVDVSWSAAGDRLFVSDYIGSNVADCYVFQPGPKMYRKISLTTILTKQFREMDRLLGAVDHGYVDCAQWIAANKIRIFAEGHGARSAKSRYWTDFKYTFDYDVVTGTATKVSGKLSRGKF
jgi:hypothetical protein